MPFCSVEYEKILYFISQIQEKNSNFRYQVLKCLSSLFSFDHNTFFLIDKDGNLTNPIGLNIDTKSFYLYKQHYFKTDIFHPINVSPEFIYNKNSYRIIDIMPLDNFQNTEYYIDFLKKQNLFYEIAIPLKHNNQLIGAIGVFRPKEDGDFTKKDVQVINKLSTYIANSLYHYIERSYWESDQQYSKSIFSHLPIGLVMLDSNFDIISHNETAYTYCLDIFNDFSHNNPIKPVIEMALTKASFSSIDSSAQIFVFLKRYSFKIVPFLLPTKIQGLKPCYHVYITKITPESKPIDNFINYFNLTEREMEIINLVAVGLNNREIANQLYISFNTVRTHLDNIRKKLGVKNRTAIWHKLTLFNGKSNINKGI